MTSGATRTCRLVQRLANYWYHPAWGKRVPVSSVSLLVPPCPAINFLIETGALLHFPDTSHGLCTLYFLCPVWLSECLERIMHLRSSQSVARNGVIQAQDLRVGLGPYWDGCAGWLTDGVLVQCVSQSSEPL